MKPKRIISLLLAICLVAGLMPTVAFATGSDKAIMLDASNISGYDSTNGYDYIYYGTWNNSPIKWRVLSMNGNSGTYSDGTETVNANNAMFLLSDGLLGTGNDGGVYFQQKYHHDSSSDTYYKGINHAGDHTSCQIANVWKGSDAQTWCSTFYNNNLTTQEQGAVLATTKSDEAFTKFAASNDILNGDKVFFLSAKEAETSDYGFENDDDRTANYESSACSWWLRSPHAEFTSHAGVVDYSGSVNGSYVYMDFDRAARPAFNLNQNSVLFTSAAEGGKSATGMDSGLTAVNGYAGNEWKLTLLDSSRNFSVTETTAEVKSGGTITLNYTGATTGANEYISVIIADKSGAQYYGRVAQPDSADGQVKIKIPDSLAAGEYTLNVFSEQYNGDYKTDYASAFAEVALTVEEAAAPGIDTGKAIQLVDSGTAANIGGGQADNIYFGTYQQSSDGSGGYNTDPIKWRVLENADGQLFLLSDQNLDVFQYHTDIESVTWETSTMRSWLNGYDASHNTGGDSGIDYTSDNFIGTAFSEKEQKAIADTTVVNDDNPDHNTEGGNDTTDQIFLLSIEEVQNADYGFTDNSSRIATNTAYVAGGGEIGGNMLHGVGEANNWWLRSPGIYSYNAAGVLSDGGVNGYGYFVGSGAYAVRPAFNLDLNSVLFTSAAAGGKSPAVDGNLRKVATYDGNEWKLTLLDEARNSFEISNATITDTITFSYSGAATGTNEYISAVVVDNGTITHYGRILQPESTSGTASFTIPDGVTLSDTVKLYVFNEQYNGDKKTDYASQLKEISRPTVDTTAPTLSNGSATRDSATTATVKFISNEAGSYYYVVDNNATATGGIDTTTAGASCNANVETTITLDSLSGEYIHIVVKDAAGNESQPLTIQIPAYTSTTFTVTVDVDPSGGGTASANYTTAAPNTEITLTATPETGYHFKEWQVTEGTFSIGTDNKFTMPAEDVTVKAVFEAHSFTQKNTDREYLASSATCTQAATYYYSCSCGAKDTNNTFTSGEALGHTPGADWQHDNGSTHWKECVNCGAKVDEAAHVYDDDGKCTVCGYEQPTYAISASPETLNFGSKTVDYTEAPAAQTVTIKNTGNQSVTVNLPTSAKYTITAGTGFESGAATLASGEQAVFTVQPNTGLGVGDYSETLTISGSDGTSANVQLSFAVTETAPVTYTLTVNLNGGSGNTTDGEYAEGAVIHIDAGSRSNYRFDRWTSSNGGSFADASSASTTFTMPAADTTITANWEYNGGGSTGGSTTDYYRLTFDTNGGSEIASILRAEYTTVDLSDYKPTREGYEFTGWYADEDLTDKITSIRLTRNTTVYAGWEEKKENPGTGFENPFTDVSENDWFYDDVMFVFINGLMVGTGDATFSPEISTSRAMIAVTLWRMEGAPAVKGENTYTDVENGAWYTEAITWANENGIAEGYGNGCFQPETPVTREQLAAFFYRYAAYKGYDITITGSLDHFNDKDNVSDWAKDTMAWAVGYELIGGKNNNMLDPQGEATRAEFAAMLQRFCQKG